MIPSNIQREHIIEAISDIDKNGVPIRRGSTKYSLEYDCKCYPPKYVVSLANKYANGVEWESENFSGGEESNHFLEQRGFCIIEKQTLIEIKTRSRIVDKISIDIIKTSSTRNHKASCFACKNSIFKLLTTTFGEITIKKPIKFPTHLKNHEDRNYYDALSRIYNALCEVNGSERFERQNLLREADYYSVEQNRIIEIDESQHFTYARKVTLENYPDYLVLGFSRERWIKQCEKLNIRDSEENRDVKRAWYDTLRDFAPLIENYAPTIRIMTGQYKYCTLQHTNHDDVSAFHREIDYCISEDESKKEHVNNTSSQALVTENVMLLLQNTAHIEVISCHSVAPDYKTDTCSNTNDEIQKKRTSDYFIEVRSDPTPKIGRIVFTWDWNPTISEA
ncbi:MAG: hypothetical protein U1C33_08440, partial [Candidatus Cloacimonadaceae bacterium]|nr:hypothetical protein [Candidatus Cloacimonadaceae bacterium]